MAKRRTVLAALGGFLGGSVYGSRVGFDLPEELSLPGAPLAPVRPDSDPAPAARPTIDPSESAFSASERTRAREAGLAARDAVVYVEVEHGGGRYTAGTGWALDPRRVVTNGHVVEGATDVTCYTLGGDELGAEVAGASRNPDAALLRVDADVPATLAAGDASELASDQPLIQIGHPSGVGYWIISLGRFERRTSLFGGGDLVTSVPGRRGNSGSPLLTLDGDVVGLTYATTPARARRPGEAPDPTDDRVHEALSARTDSVHVPIGEAVEAVRRWASSGPTQ